MSEYLPIGTVCDLNSDSNKYMIIGYKKNGNDYESLPFPEGSTNNAQNKYFNRSDVKEIYTLGYKDNVSLAYTSSLLTKNDNLSDLVFKTNTDVVVDNSAISNVQNTQVATELQFDENGVVVADGTITKEIPGSYVPSGLQFDENGIVIADNSTTSSVQNTQAATELQFDENGVVVADGTITKEIPGSYVPSGLRFDENGVVISE